MNPVYVVAGNAAVLRCELPSHVADLVTVTSWVDGDGAVFFRSTGGGGGGGGDGTPGSSFPHPHPSTPFSPLLVDFASRNAAFQESIRQGWQRTVPSADASH